MLNRYKIIFKKKGIRYHEHIKAKNIDDLAFRVRYQYGDDVLLVYVRKEEEKHDAE